jgi:hypothetical protein
MNRIYNFSGPRVALECLKRSAIYWSFRRRRGHRINHRSSPSTSSGLQADMRHGEDQPTTNSFLQGGAAVLDEPMNLLRRAARRHIVTSVWGEGIKEAKKVGAVKIWDEADSLKAPTAT